MKSFALLIPVALLFANCAKNNEDHPTYSYHYEDAVKYIINLTNGSITDYSKYVNDSFTQKTTISNYDKEVIRITVDAGGAVIRKVVYVLNPEGLASSSVDSGFSTKGVSRIENLYEYNNQYLQHNSVTWKQYWPPADSGSYNLTYTVENGNVTSMNIAPDGIIPGCTNTYTYGTGLNKLDITGFANGITGKINRNQVQHVVWSSGCPGGPSSSLACTDYLYETDGNGYVTKLTETFTPSYHLTEPGVVTRTVETTYYQYNGL